MTEPSRPARRPGPGAVLWGSVALFAVLFALLTYQLSAGTDPSLSGSTASAARPAQVRKVIRTRVVTTVVPTPGATSVSSGPATTSSVAAEPESEPVVTSAS